MTRSPSTRDRMMTVFGVEAATGETVGLYVIAIMIGGAIQWAFTNILPKLFEFRSLRKQEEAARKKEEVAEKKEISDYQENLLKRLEAERQELLEDNRKLNEDNRTLNKRVNRQDARIQYLEDILLDAGMKFQRWTDPSEGSGQHALPVVEKP